MPPKEKRGSNETAGTLGTFAGVFTPSALTILGILLFPPLRISAIVLTFAFSFPGWTLYVAGDEKTPTYSSLG